MPDTLEISDLEEFIDVYLQVIIAEANEAGFSSEDILAALGEAVERQRHAFEEDPDPAEDASPRKAAISGRWPAQSTEFSRDS